MISAVVVSWQDIIISGSCPPCWKCMVADTIIYSSSAYVQNYHIFSVMRVFHSHSCLQQ